MSEEIFELLLNSEGQGKCQYQTYFLQSQEYKAKRAPNLKILHLNIEHQKSRTKI